MDFVVLTDHRVKIKESKKRDKYSDLARELRKQWNMRVMVIPIVIGMLGMVSKHSSGDLGTLPVNRTPVKDHNQLMVV